RAELLAGGDYFGIIDRDDVNRLLIIGNARMGHTVVDGAGQHMVIIIRTLRAPRYAKGNAEGGEGVIDDPVAAVEIGDPARRRCPDPVEVIHSDRVHLITG